MTKTMIIALTVAALIAVALGSVAVSLYAYANGLRTESVAFETQLNAQYLSNQNELSAYVSGFYEQMGVVKYKSEALDKILTDYAKGRNFGADGSPSSAGFVNAVVEAVPDLAGLNIADRMMDYVQSGRTSYKNVQDKLLDMLRGYDRWRAEGFVQSYIIKNFLGVPTERLEARIGTTVKRGTEARDQMYLIVLAPQAAAAYTSGTLDPLTVK